MKIPAQHVFPAHLLLGVTLFLHAALGSDGVDATGSEIRCGAPPKRIVTLAPSLAELAADILGTDLDRIVGVSDRTDQPPALAKRPTVGPYVRFNVEKVVALRPDLVLATTDGNPKDSVLRLKEMGLSVVVIETGTFDQIKQAFLQVGLALCRPAVGKALSEQLQSGVNAIRLKSKQSSKPTVVLQLGFDPLVVAAKKTFLNEALDIVGAKNAFGDVESAYPLPSTEEFLKRNPDRILLLAMDDDLSPYEEAARRWSEFPKLKAVKSKQVQVLRADGLVRPSMRILEGLALLQKAILMPTPGAKP